MCGKKKNKDHTTTEPKEKTWTDESRETKNNKAGCLWSVTNRYKMV